MPTLVAEQEFIPHGRRNREPFGTAVVAVAVSVLIDLAHYVLGMDVENVEVV